MNKKQTNSLKLLRRLGTGRRLSAAEALTRYGVPHLSRRIYDIKTNFGIQVISDRVAKTNNRVTYLLDEKNARKANTIVNSLTA